MAFSWDRRRCSSSPCPYRVQLWCTLVFCCGRDVCNVAVLWQFPLVRVWRTIRTWSLTNVLVLLHCDTLLPLSLLKGTVVVLTGCQAVFWVSILWPVDASRWMWGPCSASCWHASLRWPLLLCMFPSHSTFDSALAFLACLGSAKMDWSSVNSMPGWFQIDFVDIQV